MRATPVIVGLFVALLALEAPAEDRAGGDSDAAAKRPKLGLVLSGGGARGASHIGVLQVLEELRVPVDYITGNSMGAIVGGYYAAGYSPDELEHEITSIDWVDIFRDLPNRRNLAFRRKQDDREFQVQMRLGFKDWSFQFPKGLVQGQKLDLTLKRLALPVWDVYDFDDLNIPYRCAATDIETGNAVILGEGELPRAIRASMSVPGAFAPVEIDGQLLVDGMVSDNIPIIAVKEMGAEVVIAIDIGTPPLKLDQIQSAFGISGQVLNLLMQQGTTKQLAALEPQDLLLKPDLTGLSTSDFPRVAEAIERGRAHAEAHADELRRFSVSEEEWQEYLERQRKPSRPPPVLRELRIENDSGISNNVIRSRLSIAEDAPLDLPTLEEDIQNIFGTDIFESVDWQLTPVEGGAKLAIRTRQKSWGTNTVRFKFVIEEDFDDTHAYLIGGRTTMMPVNSYNAEWRTDFQFGETLRIATEFYQPVTASSRWFVSPRFRFNRPETSVFDGNVRIGSYDIQDITVQLDVGRELGFWGQLRGGFGYLDHEAEPNTGAATLPDIEISTGAYFGELAVDTVDNVNFPTKGTQAVIRYTGFTKELGADATLNQLELTGSTSLTLRKTTFTFVNETFSTEDKTATQAFNKQLGGFLRLSGLPPGKVAGPKSQFNALVIYQQLARPSLLGFEMPVYVGGSVEAGNAWQEWQELDKIEDMIWGGSVWVGASTILGPAYLAFGLAEDNNYAAILRVGTNF